MVFIIVFYRNFTKKKSVRKRSIYNIRVEKNSIHIFYSVKFYLATEDGALVGIFLKIDLRPLPFSEFDVLFDFPLELACAVLRVLAAEDFLFVLVLETRLNKIIFKRRRDI